MLLLCFDEEHLKVPQEGWYYINMADRLRVDQFTPSQGSVILLQQKCLHVL